MTSGPKRSRAMPMAVKTPNVRRPSASSGGGLGASGRRERSSAVSSS